LASTIAALLLAAATLHKPTEPWLLEYYSNPRLEGAFTESSRRFADFDTSRNDLPSGIPDREDFSIRLHGCLDLAVPGVYVLHAKSDDGIRVFIDNALTIDAWNKSNPAGNENRVTLAAGVHALTIEYFNARGPGSLRLEMSEPGLPGLRRLDAVTRQAARGRLCDK
jgi:hypothetical protein